MSDCLEANFAELFLGWSWDAWRTVLLPLLTLYNYNIQTGWANTNSTNKPWNLRRTLTIWPVPKMEWGRKPPLREASPRKKLLWPVSRRSNSHRIAPRNHILARVELVWARRCQSQVFRISQINASQSTILKPRRQKMRSNPCSFRTSSGFGMVSLMLLSRNWRRLKLWSASLLLKIS